jgi:hypothetical protein
MEISKKGKKKKVIFGQITLHPQITLAHPSFSYQEWL